MDFGFNTKRTWKRDPSMVPSGQANIGGMRLVYNVYKTRSDCKKGKYTGFIFTGIGYKKVWFNKIKPLRKNNEAT